MYKSILAFVIFGMALCGCQTGGDLPEDSLPPDLAEGDIAAPPITPETVESRELPPVTEASESGEVTAPSVPPPGLALSSSQRFSDVPLPEKVKEDLEHSYVLETGGLQVGKVVYRSRAGLNELAQFYVERCPAADWTLKSLIQSDGYFIVFEKPGKQLTVNVKKGKWGRNTILVLHLTPDMETKAAP
ncbi:MAG TPA: hypothetical protein PLI09_22365 [Candidatus Hydrogenedentes bacterium]|nr:hypothetical protein [Candidatus Hydrogenedentota bacterium]